jgi:hypothetical protein
MAYPPIVQNLINALEATGMTASWIEKKSNHVLKRKAMSLLIRQNTESPRLRNGDGERKVLAGTRLSLAQIAALDELFEEQGGLLEVLRPRKSLLSQAAGARVSFLIGSRLFKSVGARFISSVDALSLGRLLAGIEREAGKGTGVHFDLREMCRDERTAVGFVEAELAQIVDGAKDTSIIAIGSAKSNIGSTLLLRRMFGGARADLPFRFCWPGKDRVGASEFDETSANETSVSYRVKGRWQTQRVEDGVSYALVATKRTTPQQSVTVIAGLTAPATLGMSEILAKGLRYELPPFLKSEPQPVSWMIARIPFIRAGELAFDFRLEDGELGEPNIIAKGVWPSITGDRRRRGRRSRARRDGRPSRGSRAA